jgi:ACS family hexuronate transporter-like MFS transporter
MTNTIYSRVVFAFVLSYTVMFSVGGRLLDAVGTRLGLAAAVAVWSVASGLHAIAAGALSLGAARLLLGVGEGACFPAVTKGAVEWMPIAQRALAVGVANGGSAFGAVLAPPITAWITGVFGWRSAFLCTAAAGAIWLASWLTATRRLPAPSPGNAGAPRVSMLDLLSRGDVQRLLAARFLFDPVFYFYMFWIPQYLSRERGMSLDRIGSLTWIPFFALGVTNIAAGRLSDLLVARGWTPRRARLVLMLCAALLTPASGLAAFAGTPAVAIGLMSILMLAHGVWIANFISLIGDTVASTEVATAVGLTGACGGVAGMLSNLVVGPVVDHYSFTPVFLTSAIVYPARLARPGTAPAAARFDGLLTESPRFPHAFLTEGPVS